MNIRVLWQKWFGRAKLEDFAHSPSEQKKPRTPDKPPTSTLKKARVYIEENRFSIALQLLKQQSHHLHKHAEYWLLLSVCFQFLGRPKEAEAALRRHKSFGPVSDDIEGRHARLLAECGTYGHARSLVTRRMASSAPTLESAISFARIQEIFGGQHMAIKTYETLIANVPQHAEALNNLANLKKQQNEYGVAEDLYRQAIALNPSGATPHRNLGDLLVKTFRLKEAIEEYKQTVALAPNNPYFLSDLFFTQHYSSEFNANAFKAVAKMWGKKFAQKSDNALKQPQIKNRPPLRIGLLSGSFRRHPVGFIGLPGLERLSPDEFTIYCYANQVGGDHYTERFRKLSKRWRSVTHLDDDQLHALICQDQIDVLIEMSGHASGHRLPIVGRRVAPLQIKWVGGQYNTMGIESIDYFLSDDIESPPEHDTLYTEKIHRLPKVYACYEPPPDVPNVSRLPALKNGYITFGCLNKSNKIGDASVALWSKCLALAADSRLILQGEVYADQNIIDRVTSMFAAHGISPQRIECRGFAPHPALFSTYNDIDIALDPHPYSGCLTTCESLWMGVPVATLPGPTFAGRHSASFLTTVGLADWIADSELSFVTLIKEQCDDLKTLSTLRDGLRTRLLSSPLCDAEQFGRDLGQALKDMWREKILTGKEAA